MNLTGTCSSNETVRRTDTCPYLEVVNPSPIPDLDLEFGMLAGWPIKNKLHIFIEHRAETVTAASLLCLPCNFQLHSPAAGCIHGSAAQTYVQTTSAAANMSRILPD